MLLLDLSGNTLAKKVGTSWPEKPSEPSSTFMKTKNRRARIKKQKDINKFRKDSKKLEKN